MSLVDGKMTRNRDAKEEVMPLVISNVESIRGQSLFFTLLSKDLSNITSNAQQNKYYK